MRTRKTFAEPALGAQHTKRIWRLHKPEERLDIDQVPGSTRPQSWGRTMKQSASLMERRMAEPWGPVASLALAFDRLQIACTGLRKSNDKGNHMSNVSVAFAKLAGIRKAVEATLNDEHARQGRLPYQQFKVDEVGRYFSGAQTQLSLLREELPDLYGDFVDLPASPATKMAKPSEHAEAEWHYSRAQLQQLAREIDRIFEIRANSELAPPTQRTAPMRCVFISRGRAPDWCDVQAYIEKDIGLDTLDLAQEANQGRTILGKLWDASERCDSAVIVMTGDDLDAEGQARARENVIHEIGFFQGKYGLSRICLLYKEGVSIPSNIHGLVYIPFPKGMVSATFGVLVRELTAMYK